LYRKLGDITGEFKLPSGSRRELRKLWAIM